MDDTSTCTNFVSNEQAVTLITELMAKINAACKCEPLTDEQMAALEAIIDPTTSALE